VEKERRRVSRPHIPALEEYVDLLPTQAAALKKRWAGLYITLVGGERPVLKLSLGPPRAAYTPKGYRGSFARLLLPDKLRLPAPSGSRPDQGELVLQ
jgi:hypothetical protein